MIRFPLGNTRSFSSRSSFSRGGAADPVPVFSAQPQTQSLYQENGLLTITGAAASPATGYQWQRSTDGTNWSDVAGQTAAVLSMANATNATATYRLKVVNGNSAPVYSVSVDVVSVYLRIQNDASAGNGSSLGTTKVTNTTYTHSAAGGTRYWSAFYTRFSDDSAFTPNGLSTARAVASWTSTNTAAVPVTPVSATGQVTSVTKTGSATITAAIGNLSSSLACTIS
ncbi:hypothetical protein Fifi067_00042 [Erwinia phage Fifi067]|nr:hypothetical protein Fifi067_00042 [Erwinia phage Fifi067]WBQ32512.1 hypothetical protein [Erwinia phage Kuerle]